MTCRAKIIFETVHPLTQEQASDLWSWGDRFTTVSGTTYLFEMTTTHDFPHLVLDRAEEIVRAVVESLERPNKVTVVGLSAEREEDGE